MKYLVFVVVDGKLEWNVIDSRVGLMLFLKENYAELLLKNRNNLSDVIKIVEIEPNYEVMALDIFPPKEIEIIVS